MRRYNRLAVAGDLRDFYWNVHAFRAGKRKGMSHYRRLGLPLSERAWWAKKTRSRRARASAMRPGQTIGVAIRIGQIAQGIVGLSDIAEAVPAEIQISDVVARIGECSLGADRQDRGGWIPLVARP